MSLLRGGPCICARAVPARLPTTPPPPPEQAPRPAALHLRPAHPVLPRPLLQPVGAARAVAGPDLLGLPAAAVGRLPGGPWWGHVQLVHLVHVHFSAWAHASGWALLLRSRTAWQPCKMRPARQPQKSHAHMIRRLGKGAGWRVRRSARVPRCLPPTCHPSHTSSPYLPQQVNDLEWTWACYADLAAGCVFAVELFLGFHTSYMASNAGQHREVNGK